MGKYYSRYLIDEHPVTFHPSLALALGINEAILLQKINLWLNNKPKNSEGVSWLYNSYKSWHEQLPFFSESTIKRAIKNLVDRGIVVKGNFNKNAYDRTCWYTINYDKLDEIVDEIVAKQESTTLCQNDTIEDFNLEQGVNQNDTTNTNVFTMNKNNEYCLEQEKVVEIDMELHKKVEEQFEEFYNLYPKKVDKSDTRKWFEKNKINDETFKEILDALKIHINLKQWTNKQYIPSPLVWLHKRKWEDEITNDMLVSVPKKIVEQEISEEKRNIMSLLAED